MSKSWKRWLVPVAGAFVILTILFLGLYYNNVHVPTATERIEEREEKNIATVAEEYNLTSFGTFAQGCKYFNSFAEAEEFYKVALDACNGYKDRRVVFLVPERFGHYGFISCLRFYTDQNSHRVFCCAQIATYPTSDYNYWREKCGGVNAS